jgi:hypothetical protein
MAEPARMMSIEEIAEFLCTEVADPLPLSLPTAAIDRLANHYIDRMAAHRAALLEREPDAAETLIDLGWVLQKLAALELLTVAQAQQLAALRARLDADSADSAASSPTTRAPERT